MSKRAIDESPGLNSEADAQMSRTLANRSEQQAMEFRQMHMALEIQNIELKLQFEEISAINLRLENANTKFSELAQASPTCYFDVSRDGTISLANRAAEKLLGMSSNRLIGVRFGIFVAEHHRQCFHNFLDQVFNTDTEHSCEIELDTTQTTIKPTILQLTATRSTTCQQCNLFAIDITIFRQSEIKERRDRERMQFAVCAANIGLWDWDLKTNQVIFSREWKSQIGYEEHEINNEIWEWESRVHPDDLGLIQSKVQAYLKAPTQCYESEFRFRHKDGSYRYIIARGSLIFDDQGNPLRMLGAHLDHTDRCDVEKRLQMMERAIQATTQGILITDATLPDCPINYVNPAFESMTGYSVAEAIGRNCRFLQGQETDPRSIANIKDCLQRKQSCKVELLNYRKDGVPFWNELSITPVLDEMGELIHFVGIQTDVTQRRVFDEQLRQAQKMEAIGLLAGGIAHDFNNLLTIIDGYAYLLKRTLIESDTSQEFLGEIRFASRRANDLTRQLLAFGRRQLQSMEVLDFNQVITETVKMLKPLIGESVQLDLRLDPCLDRMWADRGQISQILMNLTLNAKDAMLSGGTISIRTERFSQCVPKASGSLKST